MHSLNIFLTEHITEPAFHGTTFGKGWSSFFFLFKPLMSTWVGLGACPTGLSTGRTGGAFPVSFLHCHLPACQWGGGESDEKITGMGFSSDIRSFSSVIQKPFQDFSGGAASLQDQSLIIGGQAERQMEEGPVLDNRKLSPLFGFLLIQLVPFILVSCGEAEF